MAKLYLQLSDPKFLLLSFVFCSLFFSCAQKINSYSSNPEPEVAPVQAPVASAPRAKQSPKSEDGRSLPKFEFSQIGILKTPVADYVNPMLTGVSTSKWCQCRSTGSSPHIGRDLGFGKSNKSIALANSVIRQKRLVSNECGWEVILEDTHGARWLYLHLNATSLAAGEILYQGSIVGVHQNYPKTINNKGCGTGPHLHLERKTKGLFDGEARFKDCGQANNKCSYDPETPLEGKRVLQSESEANALKAKTQKETEEAKAQSADSGQSNSLSLAELSEAKVSNSELIYLDTKPLPCAHIQPAPLFVGSNLDSELNADFIEARVLEMPRAGNASLIELQLSSREDLLKTNSCLNGSCIVSWQLFGETQQGWYLSIESSGVGNESIEVSKDSLYCWPENFSGTWKAKVTLQNEDRFNSIWIQGNTRLPK